MKSVIPSPFKYKGIEIRIYPNFQGLEGLYHLVNFHAEKFAITIKANGLIAKNKTIEQALDKMFGEPVSIEDIKRNSVDWCQESNVISYYFAAVLKVNILSELTKNRPIPLKDFYESELNEGDKVAFCYANQVRQGQIKIGAALSYFERNKIEIE